MTIDEAKTKVESLRERFDAPYSQDDKKEIESLYKVVMGRTFRATSCQTCYHDAVIEIYLQLKKHGTMISEHSYVLQAGFIIHSPLFHEGKIFTNANLTDDIAEEYLKQFPNASKYVHKTQKGDKAVNISSEVKKRSRTQKRKQKRND